MSSTKLLAGTTARALRVLRTVVDGRRKLEPTWEHECKRERLAPHGKRLLRDICSGTLRWLDYYSRLIDYVAPPRLSDDLDLRLVMASTLYQTESMENAPANEKLFSAAAHACAELGKPGMSNPVQTTCERIVNMSFEQRRRASTDASIYSLPEWMYSILERDPMATSWLKLRGHLILERPDFLNVVVPPTAMYGGPSEYAKLLREHADLGAAPSTYAPHGVLIDSRPRHVEALHGVSQKVVHIQDGAQQYACSVLSPLGAGARILDACAAPGGKSRSLLHHHPGAHVVAVDTSAAKVAAMRSSLLQEGTASGGADGGLGQDRRERLRVLHADVTDVSTWWDGEAFDAILVDVPCSASGLLRTVPEVKAHRSKADVAQLRKVQMSMLSGLWKLLRPGGELLYTTCSILTDENDVNVATFLKRNADASALEVPLPSKGTHKDRRLYARRRKNGAVIFYPSEIHQGGYTALLQKGGGAKADGGGWTEDGDGIKRRVL